MINVLSADLQYKVLWLV